MWALCMGTADVKSRHMLRPPLTEKAQLKREEKKKRKKKKRRKKKGKDI